MTVEMAPPGLEGVILGRSRLSKVDGVAGRLTLAGFAVEDLAPHATFEQAVHVLWHDRMPADSEAWRHQLAALREPDAAVADLVYRAPPGSPGMAALRVGLGATAWHDASPERMLAVLPALLATFERGRKGLARIRADPSLGLAADLLRMRSGKTPTPQETRALDTYLITVMDHGLNASAFAARVVASTGADLASAVQAGMCALEGPLHGGAPGPALEALLRLREQGGDLDALTRDWVTAEVNAGRRIMGFGHRVYRVRDPRGDVLRSAAEALMSCGAMASGGTAHPLLRDAEIHERAVLETLAQLKPHRALATNVEFSTALLLHALGFAPELFTLVFAVARTAGWIAHGLEQQAEGRLIRPRLAYAGATGRTLAPQG